MKTPIALAEKLALSISEACDLSGVRRDTLYSEINAGNLKTLKIRGRRLIRRASLDKWLIEHEPAVNAAMGIEGETS